MPKSQRTPCRPTHHANNAATSFINPWPSAGLPTWTEVFQSSFPFGWYNTATLHSHRRARKIKVVEPDWGHPSQPPVQPGDTTTSTTHTTNPQSIIGTWLGHASAFVEIPPLLEEATGQPSNDSKEKSIHLLFDPIFSSRAGPNQYQGVARFKEPPCQVADLPGCDAVFISHSHYDHLDVSSIKAIFKQFPHARYFVGLGIKSWLLSTIKVAEDHVIELDWWQDREFNISDFDLPVVSGSSTSQGEKQKKKHKATVKISCVPAQHNSGRSPADQGSTLWCGWVIERFFQQERDSSGESQPTRKGAIYHAGDTGYRRHSSTASPICPIFTTIGERFGPLDLCFLPIWRGGSLGFISYMGLRLSHHDIPAALHASPTDAADMHLAVKARNTVAIHFGTFVGSENETVEAVVEFADACEGRGIHWLVEDVGGKEVELPKDEDKGRAGVLDIGESVIVDVL
jgi:N-acyl-phosphatidylethanolamine-hydrolysing phospholipase D